MKDDLMKNFLNYQTSEYDCAPVALLNGIRYLFEREMIKAELVKTIPSLTNDCFSDDGKQRLKGTSPHAMETVVNWINHFANDSGFPIKAAFYQQEAVDYTDNGKMAEILCNGGVIITHVWLEVDHYVTVIDMDQDHIYLFDPYYEELGTKECQVLVDTPGVVLDFDHPKSYNRIIDRTRFTAHGHDYYNLGQTSERVAVALINTQTTCADIL